MVISTTWDLKRSGKPQTHLEADFQWFVFVCVCVYVHVLVTHRKCLFMQNFMHVYRSSALAEEACMLELVLEDIMTTTLQAVSSIIKTVNKN